MSYFASLIWYISLLFVSSSWGLDLSVQRNPQGRLKLALDYSLATTNWQQPGTPARVGVPNVVLSTHLWNFSRPVSELFTDGQLWQLARDAVDEVSPEIAQYGIKAMYRPTATTIMAWGYEIIIATSHKGQSFSYDSAHPTPVLNDLRLCQSTASSSERHRAVGSCGEQMVAHLYYLLNPNGLLIRDLNPRAIVGTWLRPNNPVKADPCGTAGEYEHPKWGCSYFVDAGDGGQNFRVLDTSTPSQGYVLPPEMEIDQIQLCGGIITHP